LKVMSAIAASAATCHLTWHHDANVRESKPGYTFAGNIVHT
jgi:hypothetical protein